MELEPGQYIAEIHLGNTTSDMPSIVTSEGHFYVGQNRANQEYFLFGPDSKKKRRLNNDWMKVDLSSEHRIHHEFTFNPSFWAIPFDMAIIEAEKFGFRVNFTQFIRLVKIVKSEKCPMNFEVNGGEIWSG